MENLLVFEGNSDSCFPGRLEWGIVDREISGYRQLVVGRPVHQNTAFVYIAYLDNLYLVFTFDSTVPRHQERSTVTRASAFL